MKSNALFSANEIKSGKFENRLLLSDALREKQLKAEIRKFILIEKKKSCSFQLAQKIIEFVG